MALPLPTLLSQALVAFIVEFDNEFERQSPHRTTNSKSAGARQGPWLASMAMWSTCMRFVGEEGIRAGALENLARTKTNLNGMQRWGYITLAPDPSDSRPRPPRSSWLIRATFKGHLAREVWRPLTVAIEKRWQERFGKQPIDKLRQSLDTLNTRLALDLPDCLPILGYGLFSRGPVGDAPVDQPRQRVLNLPALLSRVLLAFAIEFETDFEWSLATCANLLRVLNQDAAPVRDLPRLSGVSKEAISMAMGLLLKKRAAIVETTGRVRIARLTGQGIAAQGAYERRLTTIQAGWDTRFGNTAIAALTDSLAPLVGDGTAEGSPLFAGLEPSIENWRAKIPKPRTLPHYPMVLHRGGFPDGS